MKLKCIVVDDEHFARKLLEGYIAKLPHLELVGTYKNALLAMPVLETQNIDLMFLDIQMPEIKGTDFLKILSQKPNVIFTTAYTEYALEGFELDVVDYLLKPIKFERFVQAVNKVNKRISNSKSNVYREESPSNYLILKGSHKTHKVNLEDIFYIEGQKEYVTYHTSNGKITVLQSLKKLEEDLPSEMFLRIHRSFIVNVKFVRAILGNQLEISEETLPVGRSYSEFVKNRIFGS